MTAFAKFDARAFLREEGLPPAKVAKVAKLTPSHPQTLASLATLAGPEPVSANLEGAIQGGGKACADVPREWREGIARLDPRTPPNGFNPGRWTQLVVDARALLDRWSAHADGLGWQAHNLFGCHLERPAVRYDFMGLASLIDGRCVVAMTEAEAAIEGPRGHIATYRVKPTKPGQVLLWQLSVIGGKQ